MGLCVQDGHLMQGSGSGTATTAGACEPQHAQPADPGRHDGGGQQQVNSRGEYRFPSARRPRQARHAPGKPHTTFKSLRVQPIRTRDIEWRDQPAASGSGSPTQAMEGELLAQLGVAQVSAELLERDILEQVPPRGVRRYVRRPASRKGC